MDKEELNAALEKTKVKVFIGSNAAFLGSLACSTNVVWDENTKTAETNGETIWWNPDWYSSLRDSHRETVFVHELWHPGRLHFERRGERDPYWWNVACDYVINNDMKHAGYDFDGLPALLNDDYLGMAEEQVYEIVVKDQIELPPSFYPDIRKPDTKTRAVAVNNVMRAYHQAKASKQAGNLPGHVKIAIDEYLAPVVNWEDALYRFFQDLAETLHTWARPSRRSQDIYLPSRYRERGKLQKLNYYLDISGSIQLRHITRFNSECKYVKDTFEPGEMNFIQFNVQIIKEQTIAANQPFGDVVVHSGGGTHLECVRQHIIDTQPTAAIIFTDLYCDPMRAVPMNIPVIWIVINHRGAKVPFGEVINIKE